MLSTPANRSHFILYVKDQERSTSFYTRVLGCAPTLHVPGMTEFTLSPQCVLGLMPISGFMRLIGRALSEQDDCRQVPRAEIYLLVNTPLEYHRRAVGAGAVELSGFMDRDWGHRVAYSLDDDGNVLAFAEPMIAETRGV
jgi:catechol 2,3-dioxygenase-like lactoylglutathione lyase family enzyme